MDTEKLLNAMERIQKTVDRITKIVRGLLSFARENNREEAAPRSLSRILEETHDLCRERLRRLNVRFECDLQKEELQVMDRGTQVSQVLLNLLNNSIDAVKGKPQALGSFKST